MKVEIFVQDRPRNPAGRVALAGVIHEGVGVVPKRSFRRYPSFALMLVLRGKGMYEDEYGNRRELTAGDGVLVFPGFAHTYGPADGETWDEVFVVLEGASLAQWRKQGIITPSSPIYSLGSPDRWLKRIREVLKTRDRTIWGAMGEYYAFLDLLTQIIGEARSAPTVSAWLAKAQTEIDRNFTSQGAILQVCASLQVPYETFRKRFAREAGVSPGEYLESRRMSLAIELLRYTDIPINLVSARLGFEDPLYFSKRFRKVAGMSPRSFRAQVLA